MATLTFWLNAFIPETVQGYTQRLTGGDHNGKTAIPRPLIARGWPTNTFTHLDVGFLTDQRSFDSRFTASARMKSIAFINTLAMRMTRSEHRTSGTTQVNLKTGDETGFANADMSRCRFTQPPIPTIGFSGGMPGAHFGAARGRTRSPLDAQRELRRATPPPNTDAELTLTLVAAAGDPLVGMAADIDYHGTVTVNRKASGDIKVSFDGMIDQFPAYDCYASFGDVTKKLFESAPPPGNTVVSLMNPRTLGFASRPVRGSVSFP